MYEEAKKVLKERQISKYVLAGSVSAAILSDSGKIYTVIKAVFSGEFSMEDDAFYRIGKLDAKDETARLYIEKQLKIVEKLVSDLKDSGRDYAQHLYTYNKIKEKLGE
mgnify:CR=1 FL=1